MGTKIFGENVKGNCNQTAKNLTNAYVSICEAYSNCEGQSWTGPLSGVNKAINTFLTLAKNIISAEAEYISDYYKIIDKWDSTSNNSTKIKDLKLAIKKNNSSKNLSKMQTNYKKLVKLIGIDKAKAYVKKLNSDIVFSSNSKSILSFKKKHSSASTSAATLTTVVSKPVAVSTTKKVKNTKSKVSKNATSKASTVASIKKALKTALKNGDASAVSIYSILVSSIGKKNASKYVGKLGYKARYKNGEVVAVTKKNIQSNSKTDVGKNANSSNKSKTDTGKNSTSDNTIDTSKKDDNTTSDTIDTTDNNTTVDNNSNADNNTTVDNNQDTTTEVVATEVTESDNSDTSTPSSSNENYNESYSYEESSDNEAEDIQSTDSLPTESDTTSTETLGTEEDDNDLDDSTTVKKASKVVTIDDEPDISESDSTKSSGLGVAVPLGLGAIGTGAAAVAGVRYVKNRHDNAEEYLDDYNEENIDTNSFSDDSQYVDSAQYELDDTYDDQYDGPAGSTYHDIDAEDADDSIDQPQTETSYVDPEELEDENYKGTEDALNMLNGQD